MIKCICWTLLQCHTTEYKVSIWHHKYFVSWCILSYFFEMLRERKPGYGRVDQGLPAQGVWRNVGCYRLRPRGLKKGLGKGPPASLDKVLSVSSFSPFVLPDISSSRRLQSVLLWYFFLILICFDCHNSYKSSPIPLENRQLTRGWFGTGKMLTIITLDCGRIPTTFTRKLHALTVDLSLYPDEKYQKYQKV